jgi:hypothetical protein
MASDETTIVNLALAKLGVSPIMALTDDSKQAQFAKRFYEQTRDDVLQGHRWNFAMKRATLNKLALPPEFEWSYAYQLPVDCLRVVQLNGWEPTERPGQYSIEGRSLLANEEAAEIRYVGKVTETTLYHPLFVDALATKLASVLAGPLTGSRDLPSALLKDFAFITGPQARLADAFENWMRRRVPWAQSDLVAARHA